MGAVEAALQPQQLHTAMAAAGSAEQEWDRISGGYAEKHVPDSVSSLSGATCASVTLPSLAGHPETAGSCTAADAIADDISIEQPGRGTAGEDSGDGIDRDDEISNVSDNSSPGCLDRSGSLISGDGSSWVQASVSGRIHSVSSGASASGCEQADQAVPHSVHDRASLDESYVDSALHGVAPLLEAACVHEGGGDTDCGAAVPRPAAGVAQGADRTTIDAIASATGTIPLLTSPTAVAVAAARAAVADHDSGNSDGGLLDLGTSNPAQSAAAVQEGICDAASQASGAMLPQALEAAVGHDTCDRWQVNLATPGIAVHLYSADHQAAPSVTIELTTVESSYSNHGSGDGGSGLSLHTQPPTEVAHSAADYSSGPIDCSRQSVSESGRPVDEADGVMSKGSVHWAQLTVRLHEGLQKAALAASFAAATAMQTAKSPNKAAAAAAAHTIDRSASGLVGLSVMRQRPAEGQGLLKRGATTGIRGLGGGSASSLQSLERDSSTLGLAAALRVPESASSAFSGGTFLRTPSLRHRRRFGGELAPPSSRLSLQEQFGAKAGMPNFGITGQAGSQAGGLLHTQSSTIMLPAGRRGSDSEDDMFDAEEDAASFFSARSSLDSGGGDSSSGRTSLFSALPGSTETSTLDVLLVKGRPMTQSKGHSSSDGDGLGPKAAVQFCTRASPLRPREQPAVTSVCCASLAVRAYTQGWPGVAACLQRYVAAATAATSLIHGSTGNVDEAQGATLAERGEGIRNETASVLDVCCTGWLLEVTATGSGGESSGILMCLSTVSSSRVYLPLCFALPTCIRFRLYVLGLFLF